MPTQSLAGQSLKQEQLAEFYRKLDKHFNQSELRDLAFQVGIDYDNLPGDNKADKARELVQYLERRGRSPELVAMCLRQRPNVDWPLYEVTHESAKETESQPSRKLNSISHLEPKSGWRNLGDHPVIVLVSAIAALITMIAFIIRPSPPPPPSPTPTSSAILGNRQLIEKMSFDYADSPENHGWIILDYPLPTFNHISSGFVGETLEIKSYDGRAMDYQVSTAARFGTLIEYVVKLEEKTIIYAYVDVQSKNKSTSKGIWFAFLPGTEQPKRIYEGQEWTVYVTPEQLGGGWLLLRVDLKETVKDTVGTEGWSLGQLLKLRLRGNLCVAHISIYE